MRKVKLTRSFVSGVTVIRDRGPHMIEEEKKNEETGEMEKTGKMVQAMKDGKPILREIPIRITPAQAKDVIEVNDFDYVMKQHGAILEEVK